jgi:hypothetical protein
VKSPFSASGLAESADTRCVGTDDDDWISNASPAPDICPILGTDTFCFDIESTTSLPTFWGSSFASESSDSVEFDIIAGPAAAVTAIGNIILLYYLLDSL